MKLYVTYSAVASRTVTVEVPDGADLDTIEEAAADAGGRDFMLCHQCAVVDLGEPDLDVVEDADTHKIIFNYRDNGGGAR